MPKSGDQDSKGKKRKWIFIAVLVAVVAGIILWLWREHDREPVPDSKKKEALSDLIRSVGYEPLLLPQSIGVFAPGSVLSDQGKQQVLDVIWSYCESHKSIAGQINVGQGPDKIARKFSGTISADAGLDVNEKLLKNWAMQVRLKSGSQKSYKVELSLTDVQVHQLRAAKLDKALRDPRCIDTLVTPRNLKRTITLVTEVLTARFKLTITSTKKTQDQAGLTLSKDSGLKGDYSLEKEDSGSWISSKPLVIGFKMLKRTVIRRRPCWIDRPCCGVSGLVCGVGIGKSADEQKARVAAASNARKDLADTIATRVERAVRTMVRDVKKIQRRPQTMVAQPRRNAKQPHGMIRPGAMRLAMHPMVSTPMSVVLPQGRPALKRLTRAELDMLGRYTAKVRSVAHNCIVLRGVAIDPYFRDPEYQTGYKIFARALMSRRELEKRIVDCSKRRTSHPLPPSVVPLISNAVIRPSR